MTTDTTTRLDEIKARHEALAAHHPKPWTATIWPPDEGPGSAECSVEDADGDVVLSCMATTEAVTFAANAPADIERLLGEVERLRGAIRSADVRRDPRHRVSMLVNDWAAIEKALAGVPA